jgi:hypothetical protein
MTRSTGSAGNKFFFKAANITAQTANGATVPATTQKVNTNLLLIRMHSILLPLYHICGRIVANWEAWAIACCRSVPRFCANLC